MTEEAHTIAQAMSDTIHAYQAWECAKCKGAVDRTMINVALLVGDFDMVSRQKKEEENDNLAEGMNDFGGGNDVSPATLFAAPSPASTGRFKEVDVDEPGVESDTVSLLFSHA